MPNALLERLGYAPTDRVLILHADDIGMCQATVSAWQQLLDFGLLTSASLMAPCPWFEAAVQVAKAFGPHADAGLHLTLNCEWPHYRWRPLLTQTDSGLVDARGEFHRLARPTHEAAHPAAVRAELQTQLQHAQSAGLPLTHLDSHMLTLWHPRLMPVMLDLAEAARTPAFLARQDAATITRECVIAPGDAAALAQQLDAAAAQNRSLPIDSWAVLPFGRHLAFDERLAWVTAWLDTLPPGVHSLIGHPASDTPELRAIAPDHATRTADLALLGSAALRDAIRARGIRTSALAPIQAALYG